MEYTVVENVTYKVRSSEPLEDTRYFEVSCKDLFEVTAVVLKHPFENMWIDTTTTIEYSRGLEVYKFVSTCESKFIKGLNVEAK